MICSCGEYRAAPGPHECDYAYLVSNLIEDIADGFRLPDQLPLDVTGRTDTKLVTSGCVGVLIDLKENPSMSRKRKRLSRKKSRRIYRKGMKVRRKNRRVSVPRGGIRQ